MLGVVYLSQPLRDWMELGELCVNELESVD